MTAYYNYLLYTETAIYALKFIMLFDKYFQSLLLSIN